MADLRPKQPPPFGQLDIPQNNVLNLGFPPPRKPPRLLLCFVVAFVESVSPASRLQGLD
jgi:hypothetical protein